MRSAFAGLVIASLLAAGSLTPAGAAEVTRRGRVEAVWQDPLAPGGDRRLHLSLVDGAGERTVLRATGTLAEDLAARRGRRVTVTGSPGASGAFHATAVTGATAAPQLGAKPWRTLLCRFLDFPATNPATTAYFDGMMGAASPGMDHFWQSLSFGQMTLAGSTTSDWITLPKTQAQYFPGGTISNAGLFTLAQDCVNAHDLLVSFAGVFGVNVIVNNNFCMCALGGGGSLSTGEGSKSFGLTWEGPAGFAHQAVFGQEMGHAYGIGWHSSGPGGTDANPYVSKWDVMSNAGGVVTAECVVVDPTYGCVAQGTIAYHKDVLGWLAPDRRYLSTGVTQTITLHPLDALPPAGYVAAFAGGSSSSFYTVEVRRQAGYDLAIPDPSTVIIHAVNTALGEQRAKVADATPGTGTANDEDVRWDAGETFSDPAAGVTIRVVSGPAADGSYLVEIAAPAFPGAAPLIEGKKLKVRERDGKPRKAVMIVRLSAPAIGAVTFAVRTKNGTAKAGRDYAKLTGTTGFTPGATKLKIPLLIGSDTLDERNETFFVILSKAVGGTIKKAKLKVVIVDDD